MNWLVWCLAVILSSITYQTSMKIFAGRLPLFVYTGLASITMLLISILALCVTYKSTDFSTVDQKGILFASWLGFAGFMIELSFYYLYKNNAPLSLARMFILAGSAIILLVVGVIVFKETITLNQMIGLLFTLLGMSLIIRK